VPPGLANGMWHYCQVAVAGQPVWSPRETTRRIGEFRQLESVSRTAIPGVTYNPNRQQLVKDPQLQTTNRLLERLTLGGGVARAA